MCSLYPMIYWFVLNSLQYPLVTLFSLPFMDFSLLRLAVPLKMESWVLRWKFVKFNLCVINSESIILSPFSFTEERTSGPPHHYLNYWKDQDALHGTTRIENTAVWRRRTKGEDTRERSQRNYWASFPACFKLRTSGWPVRISLTILALQSKSFISVQTILLHLTDSPQRISKKRGEKNHY